MVDAIISRHFINYSFGIAYFIINRRRKSSEEIMEPTEEMVISEPVEEIDLQLAGYK